MAAPDRASCNALVTELYRGAFNREPDPGGLASHSERMVQGTPLADLLRAFIASAEFADKHGRETAGQAHVRVDRDPNLPIEFDLSLVQLGRLWAHVGASWAALGQTDPYWSVLSDPRFHLPNMSDRAVLEAFHASGEGDVTRLEAWLARNGLAIPPGAVCGEYGCGVGRVSGWLAEHCGLVRAFDISPTHIARADAWLRQRGTRNVEFQLVRTPHDLDRLAGIDLFFSMIVLQHNPPPIMRLVLDRAFAHLNPGGLAFFQVPTYMRGYRFDLERYLSGIDGKAEIEMHCLPQQEVFAAAARHGLVPVEIEQDGLIGAIGASHTFLMRKLRQPPA